MRSWRLGNEYCDIAGFCKSAKFEEIEKQNFNLSPGRYAGAEKSIEDTEEFEQKIKRLVTNYEDIKEASVLIDQEIMRSMNTLGFSKT